MVVVLHLIVSLCIPAGSKKRKVEGPGETFQVLEKIPDGVVVGATVSIDLIC